MFSWDQLPPGWTKADGYTKRMWIVVNFDIVTYIYEFNNMSKGSLKSFEKKVP